MLDRNITVDFSRSCGRIKPLGGACLGPLFDTDVRIDLSSEYRELGVPAVRTASSRLPREGSLLIDIRRVFPDPDLDERFPESYRFCETDEALNAIKESGADILLSLGEVWDARSVRRMNPCVPPDKWARIAEKIILHYNRGWGGGFKHSIKYIEIWPGADRADAFASSPREYYELYRIVASHLKSVFPTLRIGGYSSGGFYALNHYDADPLRKGYIEFLGGFLSYITSDEARAPLDFLSWECSAESAEELSLHANYARSFLSQYGLKRAQSIVSELSLDTGALSARTSRDYPARLAATLAVASDADIDMMLYSTMHPYSRDNAILCFDDSESVHRYSSFGVMSAFGRLYSLGTRVYTTDNYRREAYALAAASDGEGAILLATGAYTGTLAITLVGSRYRTYSIKGMLGGGKRGAGFSTSEENIPLTSGQIRIKVGRSEVYLITLSV